MLANILSAIYDFNTHFNVFLIDFTDLRGKFISKRLQSDKLVFNFDREFHAQFKPQTENQQQFNMNFDSEWRISEDNRFLLELFRW